jgi:PAS domain S-box-containing protein
MVSREGLKILYAEDDPAAARLFQKRFTRAGYRVDVCADGIEALEKWDTGGYDLLALDHDMPRRTGLEVIRTLAAREAMPPIIVITGAGNETIAAEAMRLGVEDYVVKDTDVNYLKTVARSIEQAIEKRSLVEEKQKAENELWLSRENYRYIVEHANEGIWSIDSEGRTTFANTQMAEMLGTTVTDMTGRLFYDFMDDEWRVTAGNLMDRRREGAQERHDFKFRRSDGSPLWAIVSAVPRVERDGSVTGVFAFVADITDRKIMEERLLTSLKEKDALLREVHHRVRNNLAVIISLLGLQSQHLSHKSAEEALSDVRDRIHSMALAFDMVYRSDDLADVRMDDYLRNLVEHRVTSLPGRMGLPDVSVRADDICLGLETAVIAGFIVNELVTNSVRHAFAEQPDPTIEVSLVKCGEDRYELRVADNGAGMPENISLNDPATLGLQLVELLTTQLSGSLTQDLSHQGTAVIVTFSETGSVEMPLAPRNE